MFCVNYFLCQITTLITALLLLSPRLSPPPPSPCTLPVSSQYFYPSLPPPPSPHPCTLPLSSQYFYPSLPPPSLAHYHSHHSIFTPPSPLPPPLHITTLITVFFIFIAAVRTVDNGITSVVNRNAPRHDVAAEAIVSCLTNLK